MLPYDYARCEGQDWDPFGVQPECIDCQRRTSPGGERQVWMMPPNESPCQSRIAPEATDAAS